MLDPRFRHVVAVCRTGSFTAAAERVGITQSAVTRSIADLEREIGYSLFVRTTSGTILTEQGRDFAERAQKLLEDAEELLRRPHGREDVYSGVLRIGVCPASMEFVLGNPLAELLRRYPSVRLDVNGLTVERAIQQLRTGHLDVAVGFEAAFTDWPDLRRQPIRDLGSTGALFVRAGHPILKAGCTEQALADYDFVSPSDSRPYGTIIRALYEDTGRDWRKHVHTVDFFPTVKKIVAATDAIGVMMAGGADRLESFRKQFVVLDSVGKLAMSSPMSCAVRARWEPRPATKAFMALMTRVQLVQLD